jgi:hypothetical protein
VEGDGGAVSRFSPLSHYWGWWRLRLWRDYYKLVTDTGLLVIVYYDLLEGKWYLQQLFD